MIGKVLGGYRIVRELSSVGQGTVYRAEHELLGRPAAVKLLRPELSENSELVQRFFNEAKAATAIRHPGIIEVYDFGQLDAESLYLTMALVPGQELGELMAGRQLPYDELYPLLIQLLEALAYVHRRGYVHCDLKSENVRVRPDGTLKLMDFGLMLNAGAADLPDSGGPPPDTPV